MNRSKCGKQSGKRNFTLIELLIVVAIIAILASILMPALNKAVAKGKSITCMNKLKQQGTAFALYCSDNDDYLPSRSNAAWNDLFFNRLVGIPNNTGGSKKADTGRQGKYLPISVLACPEMPPKNLTGEGTNYDWWCVHPDYGFNDTLYYGLPTSNDGIHLSRRVSAIVGPSRKYLIADTYAQTSSGVPDMQQGHWRLINSPGSKTNTGYACFAGRHSKNFNAIHVDGSGFSKMVINPFDPYSQTELQIHTNLKEFYWNK